MPYTKQHKRLVRKKILTSATEEFKTLGIKDVSVPKIMKGANLTHGGFYAHFKNKKELVAEACHNAIDQTIEKLQHDAAGAEKGMEMEAVLDRYLSISHRDNPKDGCIMPSILSEMSRSSDDIRNVFQEEFKRLVSSVAKLVDGNKDKATALVSGMVGGMLFARSISDPVESEKILESTRNNLKQLL